MVECHWELENVLGRAFLVESLRGLLPKDLIDLALVNKWILLERIRESNRHDCRLRNDWTTSKYLGGLKSTWFLLHSAFAESCLFLSEPSFRSPLLRNSTQSCGESPFSPFQKLPFLVLSIPRSLPFSIQAPIQPKRWARETGIFLLLYLGSDFTSLIYK